MAVRTPPKSKGGTWGGNPFQIAVLLEKQRSRGAEERSTKEEKWKSREGEKADAEKNKNKRSSKRQANNKQKPKQ